MNTSHIPCSPPCPSALLSLLILAAATTCAPAQNASSAPAVSANGPVYWMPDTSADPRQKDFSLPIYIALPQGNTGCNPDDLRIQVAFNPTLFYPRSVTRGAIISNMVSGPDRVLEISLAGTQPLANGTLTSIVGDVLLGNSESTPFILRSVTCGGVQVADSVFDGFFRMTGSYCEEGSDRLLVYRSGFGIKRIAPNPAKGPVAIQILGVELAPTSLEVYSAYGERVFATSWTPAAESELEREVMLPQDIPAGVYQVVLRSPGRGDVQSLIIAR